MKRIALLLAITTCATMPARAIDPNCTATTNLQLYDCPEGSTDWYELISSSRGLVQQLDALSKTAPSSFTVLGAFEATGVVEGSGFTEGGSDTLTNSIDGNSATATNLAADPNDCANNQFADEIAASGNLSCKAIADADVPDGITVDEAVANTAQLLTVAVDTTSIAGDATTNTAQLVTVAADTTTIAGNVATNTAQLLTVAVDTTTHAALTGSGPHGAVSANSANQIVHRDGSGNFSAGTITADLTGTASVATDLAADPNDCSANQFANAIDAQADLTCAAIADADVPNTITVDLSAAATALAANGDNCAAGQSPLGVDASGAVEGCFTPSGAGDTTAASDETITGFWNFSSTFTRAINTATSFIAADFDPETAEWGDCIANSTATIIISGTCVIVDGSGSVNLGTTGNNYGISYRLNGVMPTDLNFSESEREDGAWWQVPPSAGNTWPFNFSNRHCGLTPGTMSMCVVASFQGAGTIGQSPGRNPTFRITEY